MFVFPCYAKIKTEKKGNSGRNLVLLTIDQHVWHKRIIEAIKIANDKNQPVIISEVLHLHAGDPFTFFNYCKKKYNGDRLYWRDPHRLLTFAGCGTSYRIFFNAQPNRYTMVESKWQKLLDLAIHYGEKVEGTGPLLFGGFSFDPLKQKTALWKKFADSHFYLPTYLLTHNQKGLYLTINIVVEPNTSLDAISLPDEGFIQQALAYREDMIFPPNHVTSIQDIAAEEWVTSVEQAIERMHRTEVEKVVLAREVQLTLHEQASIGAILHHLLEREQTSYVFALESGEDCFIGATPERLVQKEGTKLLSTCLAGSTPRGRSEEEDLVLGNNLLSDAKNRREHQIVVDMIQAALQTECTKLSIPNEPVLMKLQHIQHLFTPVVGECNESVSLLRLVEKLHPTPALGGWPKQQSVDVIREIEPLDRGLYGAPIGWIDALGNGEFAVAIRSALIHGQAASLFAGCGVVVDSDPEAELQETRVKIKPMLTAIGGIHRE